MSKHLSTSQALQPLHFPLWGSRLIEASAGTGKPGRLPRCICGWCWGMAWTRASPDH